MGPSAASGEAAVSLQSGAQQPLWEVRCTHPGEAPAPVSVSVTARGAPAVVPGGRVQLAGPPQSTLDITPLWCPRLGHTPLSLLLQTTGEACGSASLGGVRLPAQWPRCGVTCVGCPCPEAGLPTLLCPSRLWHPTCTSPTLSACPARPRPATRGLQEGHRRWPPTRRL